MSDKCRYWHMTEDGNIQCDLCPRFCRLKDEQRGLCFVRQRQDDKMILTTYGRSSGFCIDPMEKKPLHHFLPDTSILSFGTAGCNLTCKFCQNWDMSKSRKMDKLQEVASPKQIADMAKELDCRSVAYTYNDPVIFLEYAVDIAQACREIGIRSVAVTAGYITPEAGEEFFHHMDAANVDLKGFTNEFYRGLCTASIDPVLETLKYIKHETDVWLEITTLLIPGHNDSENEMHRLSEWILSNLGADVPLHFSAFHPDYKMTNIPPTPHSTLSRARDIAINTGIHYVFAGNVIDRIGASTYCHNCGKLIIGRHGYDISDWYLSNDNKCKFCQSTCAGIFE